MCNASGFCRLLLALVCLSASRLACADSEAAERQVAFNIPQQEADVALTMFAEQADLTLIFPPEMVEDIMTNELVGLYTAEEGVAILLAGTGLTPTFSNPVVLSISTDTESANGGESVDIKKKAGFLAAVAAVFTGANAQEPADSNDQSERQSEALEEIVVTGTRIKGVKDRFSPVVSVSREEIDLAGYSNVAEVFEYLPQNFGGGATVDGGRANTADGPGGSGVNLRGLGNEATLVLLNGRRMAAGGSSGTFVDISAIPTSAIERIEIVTDGASAIYGSDAVAGVVNIILRSDFDGAETRASGRALTEGDGEEVGIGQTFGFSNPKSNGLLTLEYRSTNGLDSSDKDWAEDAVDPTFLLPETTVRSIFATGGLKASEAVSLSVDAYYNDRQSEQFTSFDTFSFVQAFQQTGVEQIGGAVALDTQLPAEWTLNVNASYSRSEHFSDDRRLDSDARAEDTTETEVLALESIVEGSVFEIARESARAVFGIQYRDEKLENTRLLVSTNFLANDVRNDRDVLAVFGEIYLPIVSETNAVAGINSLAITAAARYENYSDVGSSTDPRLGFSWAPVGGINIRGTYGTSFRAPRLDQLVDRISASQLTIYEDPTTGTESVALVAFGDTDELDPEESTSWTVGFDLEPEALPGFSLRATYFDIDYEGRLGLPFLNYDALFRVVGFSGVPEPGVDLALVQDIVDRSAFFVNFSDFIPVLGDFDVSDTDVLLDARNQNTSTSKVAGFDLEVLYDWETEVGDFGVTFSGSYLTDYTRQFSPTTAIDNLIDTFGNPAALKLRAGARWSGQSVAMSLFVNHVSDYIDDDVVDATFAVDAWTTVDLSARFDLGEKFPNRFGNGLSVSLSILNLFDEDPPEIGVVPLRISQYDAANADPYGRRVGLLISKVW